MKIGTKSVICGAHCWPIHTIMLFISWWRLYGFPWDPRLWVAFACHDLGYIGKPDMDGDEGLMHPILGARIMTLLFDHSDDREEIAVLAENMAASRWIELGPWGIFTACHSRSFAKRCNLPTSRLCIADKYVMAIEPTWLYLPRVIATREVEEYLCNAAAADKPKDPATSELRSKLRYAALVKDRIAWHRALRAYMHAVVERER